MAGTTYCLDNLNYGKDALHVAPHDAATRQWLDMLVEAGLYAKPQSVRVGNAFAPKTYWRYRRTPMATKLVRSNRLCFAEGLKLLSIDEYTTSGAQSEVTVTLQRVAMQPWAQTAQTLNAMLAPSFRHTFTLVMKNDQWRVLAEKD